MSSNQTVLEALAQEGIRITEEELLRVMERGPCESTSHNGAVAYPHGLRNGKTEEGRQQLTLEPNTNTTQLAGSRPVAAHFAEATDQPAPLTGQGQDRTRVPWYAAVLCRVAIHRGQWEYLAEGHCAQTRTCERCGTTKVRTKHQREWQYDRAVSCQQTRICRRCNALSGTRTRHEQWSESWNAGRDESAHRCLRCGIVETWSTASSD
jgi:ribosomal protein L40E